MNRSAMPPTDDWLEAFLRADAQNHASQYISDDGFTTAVIGRLPASAASPAWRRPVVAVLWLALAIAAAMALPGWVDDVFRGVVGLLAGHRITLTEIAAAVTLFGVLTWTATVYAARSE